MPLKTADLADAHGDDVRSCDLPFRAFGKLTAFHGPIATVRCFEDNALLKAFLEEPGNGRVMVVDGGGSTRFALVGDMLGLILQSSGWAGIVINGAVRDSAELDEMDVGVRALVTAPRRGGKTGEGERDVVVRFGGTDFRPGEWLYCDADGVLVSAEALG